LTRTKNVRNSTKFRRSIKAISPVIATLLMIAIAVVASLVVYAWVGGYMGTTTEKAGKAIAIPSFAVDSANGPMKVYVQNVGQGTVQIGSVYIDDVQKIDFTTDVTKTIAEGSTIELTIPGSYNKDTRYDIKVTTTEGTFMTTTGKPGSGGSTTPTPQPVTYAVTFVLGTGGLSMNPVGAQTVGGTIAITATETTGYHFTSWSSSTGSITFADANLATTSATINGAGTVTANFAADTVQYSVTFALGANGATITPTAGPHTYDAGSVVNIVATANSGYHFSSWSSTSGSITFANANSASTTATIGAAGTVTANFAANTPLTITLRPNAAGTTTQLNAQGTGTANWDRVDEVTSDSATTYVRGTSNDGWQVDTYNIPDQTLSGTITNVRIYIVALESIDRPSDTYGRTAIAIGSGSIEYGTQLDLTTTWDTYSTQYATKTGNLGSGAWTWTDINNLQIGVSLQSHLSSGNNWRYAQCTQVWVEITYIPA
jgi:flagellin-like protein